MIQIRKKEDCCGCTACESICGKHAITLIPDEVGFLYPQIDFTKCVDCHLCEKVCPIIARKDVEEEPDNQQYYAARHTDGEVLMNSSSGGAFTALAQVILDRGGVVLGATYDSNMAVCHIPVDKQEDLWKLRGSKYVQSNIRGVYQEVKAFLTSGRYVLFSGTPCQVDGLRNYLRKDYDKLLTVDVVCHAAGNPKLFHDYIDYLEEKYDHHVTWINMRDKEKGGWSHHFVQSIMIGDGKKVFQSDNMITWWSIYYSHMTNRPSCHDCKYTNYNRPSDITIADFWDDKNKRPELYSARGTSLLIVNTLKGERLLKDRSDLNLWVVTKDETWQPCLEEPTPCSPCRDEFWKLYYQKGYKKAFKKFFYVSKATRYKWWIKDHIAKMIGYGSKN